MASIASMAMRELISWRNPNGPETEPRNRSANGVTVEDRLRFVATEVALVVVAAFALLESTVYAILALPNAVICMLSGSVYMSNWSVDQLNSSAFTVIWAIADALIYNIFFKNIFAHESTVRYVYQMFIPCIGFVRERDIAQYARHFPFEESVSYTQAIQMQIDRLSEGANFLKEHVFAGLPEDDMSLIKDYDASVFQFVGARAIFIYVAGDKCEEDIPEFFKEDTRTLISQLRANGNLQENKATLSNHFSSLTQYNTPPEGEAKSLFDAIREQASEEMQMPFLVGTCLQFALEDQ